MLQGNRQVRITVLFCAVQKIHEY
nr:unnamed protein product [Callosobruchus chinensis]